MMLTLLRRAYTSWRRKPSNTPQSERTPPGGALRPPAIASAAQYQHNSRRKSIHFSLSSAGCRGRCAMWPIPRRATVMDASLGSCCPPQYSHRLGGRRRRPGDDPQANSLSGSGRQRRWRLRRSSRRHCRRGQAEAPQHRMRSVIPRILLRHPQTPPWAQNLSPPQQSCRRSLPLHAIASNRTDQEVLRRAVLPRCAALESAVQGALVLSTCRMENTTGRFWAAHL
mmetsp:Transcript_14257/g.36176  ORF Transcript_14257/g.36176 Transcript_14257/m.36176 type:complete len:226 (-) Transcript_14257:661-1338(-)